MTVLIFTITMIATLAFIWLAFNLAKVHRAQQNMLEADDSANRELLSERDALLKQLARIEGRVEEKSISQEEESKRLEQLKDLLRLQIKEVLGDGGQKLAGQAKEQVESYLKSLDKDDAARKAELVAIVAPIKEALDEVAKSATEQTKSVGAVNQTIQRLGSTADDLYAALQEPVGRGNWGEFSLKRVVESAGMQEYCHFDTQVSVKGDDGKTQRPDMVVRLAGQRQIVVDSKVSLLHYDAAIQESDPEKRQALLEEHAKSVRKHIKSLSGKGYHKQFSASPDFVVMYIPGDQFYHAALKVDHSLIEHAAKSGVMIATPMILIAMLRIVAQGWQDVRLAKQAVAIRDAGAKVYDQLRIVAERIAEVGDKLSKTSDAYNGLVTGFDGRLWTRAKALSEMGCGDEQPKGLPEPVDTPIKHFTRISGDGSTSEVPQIGQPQGGANSMEDGAE